MNVKTESYKIKPDEYQKHELKDSERGGIGGAPRVQKILLRQLSVLSSKNMTEIPGHEIILVQTAEQRQECYDVVLDLNHNVILFRIIFCLANSCLSSRAKVPSRNRDR